MSLVGSLEDLGLADILQIVSLSRKSGMLALRSEGGDGRIFLRDGLVQGAAIKGEAENMRGLLVDGGFVEGDAFDRARSAVEGGADLVEAIQQECGLPAERLESLRREHVERAVMRMFSWRSGEFSFEIREDLSGDDQELLLPSGLNTQYLAMEASRLRDENTRSPGLADADFEDDPVFSGEEPAAEPLEEARAAVPAEAEAPAPPAEPAEVAAPLAESAPVRDDAVDALALAAARHADAGGEVILPAEPVAEEEGAGVSEVVVAAAAPSAETRIPVSLIGDEVPAAGPAEDAPASVPGHDATASVTAHDAPDAPASVPRDDAPASGPEPDPAEATPAGTVAASVRPDPVPAKPAASEAPAEVRRPVAHPGTSRQGAHLVAFDPDLSALEWLKASVDGLFGRVHIFQRSEIAIERIRQYLMRGVLPLVLVRDQGDQAEVAEGFVKRLRSLAPTMPLLALRPEGADEGVSAELDGVVFRPCAPSPDPERWSMHEELAERLRDDLASRVRGVRTDTARRRARNALARLKHVSDRLRDPSTQGEVLTLVLEYAAETFSRVAMFMLRDDVAAGIAQLGLPPTGGPDDEGMRGIELGTDEMPELFRQVLEQRGAVRSALAGPLDRRLAMRLGAATPAEAYAAPIESGGCVVAIVYADNLPEERPIRDTTALEIVLHEAGLALDRALLERALAERES